MKGFSLSTTITEPEAATTLTEPELDFSVLDKLDFAIPCEIPTHATNNMCSQSDAEWIVETHHLCAPATRLVCVGFKDSMVQHGKDLGGKYTCRKCEETVDFEEFFDPIGKI
jgi:hypothetical protein